MIANRHSKARAQKAQIELERHEAKYIVHPSQVPAIREFIMPFVVPDPNATGDLPEYLVTTLQMDSDDMSLYRAKEVEAINRFKLRVRTYDTHGKCPCFLEIKRKLRGVIVKSRATVPSTIWSGDLIAHPERAFPMRSRAEENNLLNFVRLTRQIGARPIVRIRYRRESYLGKFDNYARVTFDNDMKYQNASTWDVLGEPNQRWWNMDSTTALNRDFPGVILELKTYNDAPLWMLDLVERFDLTRIGFCKYFTAVRLDSLFTGATYSETSENTNY